MSLPSPHQRLFMVNSIFLMFFLWRNTLPLPVGPGIGRKNVNKNAYTVEVPVDARVFQEPSYLRVHM